ncbi:MAG: Hsp70 family protein, partial [Holophagae bacterium]
QTHATDDQAKRKQIETRNKLDGLVYSTEKLVNDNRDKLPDNEVTTINEVLADAKKALEEGAEDRMEQVYERLTQASHQIAAALYQTATDQGGGDAGGDATQGGPDVGSAGSDDEVIDAEYVDVEAEDEK